MSRKLPYIKIYPGDELKLSAGWTPMVYGCYSKLRFALWEAPVRGRMEFNLSQFRRITGADDLQEIEQALAQLLQERVFAKVEEGGKVFLQDEKMMAAEELSEVRAAAGREGGRRAQAKTKAKEKQTIKQSGSNGESFASDFAQAKSKQKPDIDYDNEYEHEIISEEGKGGAGEKGNQTTELDELLELQVDDRSLLSIEDCKTCFLHHEHCAQTREVLVRSQKFEGLISTEMDRRKRAFELLGEWLDCFNQRLSKETISTKQLGDYCFHFHNFIKSFDTKHSPDKILKNEGNGQYQRNGSASHRYTPGTAILTERKGFRDSGQ